MSYDPTKVVLGALVAIVPDDPSTTASAAELGSGNEATQTYRPAPSAPPQTPLEQAFPLLTRVANRLTGAQGVVVGYDHDVGTIRLDTGETCYPGALTRD